MFSLSFSSVCSLIAQMFIFLRWKDVFVERSMRRTHAGEALNVDRAFVLQSHYNLKVLISIFDVQQSLTKAYNKEEALMSQLREDDNNRSKARASVNRLHCLSSSSVSVISSLNESWHANKRFDSRRQRLQNDNRKCRKGSSERENLETNSFSVVTIAITCRVWKRSGLRRSEREWIEAREHKPAVTKYQQKGIKNFLR